MMFYLNLNVHIKYDKEYNSYDQIVTEVIIFFLVFINSRHAYWKWTRRTKASPLCVDSENWMIDSNRIQ